MSRLRAWWRNENYDPEHMRRYRQEHPEDDLPDELVAQTLRFQRFAAGEAFRDVGKTIRAVLRGDE